MLKRLVQVAFLTGAAHVSTLLSIKYVSLHTTVSNLKSVGELDSLSNLIITVIALGLLMATVRDIAISKNWRIDYKMAQQARLTMSLFLIPLGFFSIYENSYYIFFISPFFALNGDYALYGRSLPVTASALAFVKVFVPSLSLVFASMYCEELLIPFFITSILFSHVFTGYLATRILKLPYFVMPSFKTIFKYVQSLRLGIVSLSFYFLGLGLISVAAFFYSDAVVARAYLGIKFYTIFKGVLRILNQSFIKEMIDDDVCLKVDQLAFIAGNLFFISAVIFPESFTLLFLGKQFINETKSLILLVLSGLICGSFTSFTTRTMLDKKDNAYSKWAAISIISSIALMVLLSVFFPVVKSIYFSLTIGELILVIGLIRIIGKYELIKTRARNMLSFLPFVFIPVIVRLVLGDTNLSLIIGTASYALILLITQYKKLGLNFNIVNVKNAKY